MGLEMVSISIVPKIPPEVLNEVVPSDAEVSSKMEDVTSLGIGSSEVDMTEEVTSDDVKAMLFVVESYVVIGEGIS